VVNRYGSDMKKIYDKGEFADVEFTFKDTSSTLLAHKVILAHHSTYFARVFAYEMTTKGFKSKRVTPVAIDDVRFEVFEKLLEFLYTWRFDVASVPDVKIEKGKMVTVPAFVTELVEACRR